MIKKDKSVANKAKLVLLIGIPLLLVLSLALVFGKKPYQEEEQFLPVEEEQEEVASEQAPVEPEEKIQAHRREVDMFKRTKRITARGLNKTSGKPWQITTIGDPNDPNWQTYQPKDVTVIIDKENMTATVSWTESNLPIKPNFWLVGYNNKTFDLIESFQQDEELKDYWISWSRVIDGAKPEADNKQKSVTLALDKLPQPVNTLYFAIYIRTKSSEGQYIDYIFGDNNSSEIPFSKSLTD